MKIILTNIFLIITLISCHTSDLNKFSNVKNDEKYIIEKRTLINENKILVKFQCDNQIKTIKLPKDLIKTFNVQYEEGYFKDFIFSDGSSISILCGCCATFGNDKKYDQFIDSLKINENQFLITNFNNSTKKFSQTLEFIKTENVKNSRRKEFEKMIIEFATKK